jgi:hypothetical protein
MEMLMTAVETEAANYVERHRDERDAEGRASVMLVKGAQAYLGRGDGGA